MSTGAFNLMDCNLDIHIVNWFCPNGSPFGFDIRPLYCSTWHELSASKMIDSYLFLYLYTCFLLHTCIHSLHIVFKLCEGWCKDSKLVVLSRSRRCPAQISGASVDLFKDVCQVKTMRMSFAHGV